MKVDIVCYKDTCASIWFLTSDLDSNVERQEANFTIVKGLVPYP